MAFGSAFSRPFSPAFYNTGAAVNTWWLSGGISAANAIAAYQPKGAASLAASYINLANPSTYTAAPGVAPTWDTTNGWIFDGTRYLDSGISPSSVSTAIIRFSNGATNDKYLFGSKGASTFMGILPSYSTGSTVLYLNKSTTDAARKTPTATSGVFAFSGTAAYRNGIDEGLTISVGTAPTYTIFIGGANSSTGIQNACTARIQAIAFYDTTLSAAQISALTIAMNAL